jgi:preprotein translocase subunit SecG
MTVLKVILTVLFIIVCIAIVGIVLVQDGESGGLTGSISGSSETFWSKNKGRSTEGAIQKVTRYLIIAFFVLALVLNLSVFA